MSSDSNKLETIPAAVAFAERGDSKTAMELMAGAADQGTRPPTQQRKGNPQRRAAAKRATLFGAMSLGLYGVLFAYSDTIMHYFTMGGVHAVLPIATVFLFSYVHGTFAGELWTSMGITASKKVGKPAAKQDEVRKPARDTRPRATLNA
jgi:hypothetical protein